LSEDDEVDIDGGVNLEGGDVLDDGGWAVDVDDSLVDSHLISIPGVGTFSAWRFSDGNSEDLGWDSVWTLNLVSLCLGSGDDLGASVLESFDFSTFKSHSDSLDFFEGIFALCLFFVVHIDKVDFFT
tara:strand:+ start:131 stop:511 length:381 start_codon:yes stop_codon:yes gene_type:complete